VRYLVADRQTPFLLSASPRVRSAWVWVGDWSAILIVHDDPDNHPTAAVIQSVSDNGGAIVWDFVTWREDPLLPRSQISPFPEGPGIAGEVLKSLQCRLEIEIALTADVELPEELHVSR
jgi:hypothetical protein